MTSLLARIWKMLKLPKLVQLNVIRILEDQFLVGVTGIIFNQKNEILLFRHTYRQQEWSLPGGYIKAKEHPKEGLEREIEEESGLTVSADRRLHIRTDRDTARLDIVYAGTFIGGKFRPSGEVSEGKFFSFDELPLLRKADIILIRKVLDAREQSVNHTKPTGSIHGIT